MSNSILIASSRKYPSIPTVGGDLQSHTNAIAAIRDAIQIHERRTADKLSSFVRLKELVDLGVVRINGNRMELAISSSGSSGGSSTLAGLDDVDVSAVSDGDSLVYDATYGLWVPQAITSGSSSNVTPDTHPSSPNAMDDEFEAGTLNTSLWTWFNQGSATATLTQGSLFLNAPAASGDNLRGIEQTKSGTGKWRGKFSGICTANFNVAALYFRNTGNSRILTLDVCRAAPTVAADTWANATTFNAQPGTAVARTVYTQPGDTGWLYAELEDDGTNLIGRFSFTGINGTFVQFVSVTRAAYVGTPDRVGILASSNNAGVASTVICDWFRKVA